MFLLIEFIRIEHNIVIKELGILSTIFRIQDFNQLNCFNLFFTYKLTYHSFALIILR